MKNELPPGYVPPQPTHPRYGYLTPEEVEALDQEDGREPRPTPTGWVPQPPGGD